MEKDLLTERTIETTSIYDGKMIQVEQIKVELPNGNTSTRDIVRHPGAVAVLADVDGQILFVEQYRIAPGQILLEIPAGKLDAGEAPLACAKRELQEETGYEAESWVEIGSVFTSPGFADERIYIYHASNLHSGERNLDDDEFLNVKLLSVADVKRLMEHREITDAKTLIALQWWLLRTHKE